MTKEIQLPESLDAETAADVLRDYARHEEPTINETETLDALRQEIEEFKAAFAAILAEESPQSAETLARQDADALTEPFRDDEGAIDVDTLRQTPQTGAGGGTDTGGGTGGGDPAGFDPDALSLEDRDRLQLMRRKHKSFKKRGVDKSVDALESEMTDIAGVDDMDDIDWEVL